MCGGGQGGTQASCLQYDHKLQAEVVDQLSIRFRHHSMLIYCIHTALTFRILHQDLHTSFKYYYKHIHTALTLIYCIKISTHHSIIFSTDVPEHHSIIFILTCVLEAVAMQQRSSITAAGEVCWCV